jgi:DMSO/TMAO reductase YedYZ molybdopterin-dependent catalytic subunit
MYEPMNRRKFIIGAIAGGVGLAEYIYTSEYMNQLADPSRDLSVKEYARYGAKAALAAITPNDQFYITSKGDTPRVEASSWRLKIDGLVAHPIEITYDQLLGLPRIERILTLECISNPIGGHAIGNAQWTGTPLKPLLEHAHPAPEASHVIIEAADGYSTGHPIERIWNEYNFLAYRMNGDLLPPVHGYPARIFIPGKFGMKQPKWITRIRFVNRPYLGYWETRGWSDDAERWAQARFTDLKDGAKLRGRNIELFGYAVGNLDGIKAVELSFDGGRAWQNADIFSNPSPLVWVFWKFRWNRPQHGKYEILVRAVDGKGRIEGADPLGIYPAGATGLQRVKVTIV